MVYYDLCHVVYLKIDSSLKFRTLKYRADNLETNDLLALNRDNSESTNCYFHRYFRVVFIILLANISNSSTFYNPMLSK